MIVAVQNNQRDFPIPKAIITQVIKAFLKLEAVECQEVSVSFISDKNMRTMHLEFFGDPSPTDCISFPIDSDDGKGYKYLGEVFVCPQVASDYASENKINYIDELALYVVHGLLHLCGYDDVDPLSRRQMRKREAYHMGYLRLLKLI